MWRNYFKTGIRALIRNKFYSAINIIGLAVGIGFCLLVAMFIHYDWSFNRFNTQFNSIYKIITYWNLVNEKADYATSMTACLKDAIDDRVPGIENVARVCSRKATFLLNRTPIGESVTFVDPEALDIFTFDFIEGSPSGALENLNSIILTRSSSEKYFPNENPIGKMMEVTSENETELFHVTGVVENWPATSSMEFEFILPYRNLLKKMEKQGFYTWGSTFSETYITLKPSANPETVLAAIETIKNAETNQRYPEGAINELKFQPFSSVHSGFMNNTVYPTETDATSTYILLALALIILIIACINFTTMSIGRSLNRSREIGVRKVMGAVRTQIMRQFWVEMGIVTFFGMLLGLLFADLGLPTFNHFADANIEFALSPALLASWLIIWGMILLVAGSYPALVLSRFSPINAMKGETKVGGKNRIRQGLIFCQFTFTIGLVAVMLIMTRQFDFIQKKDLGYSGDQILVYNFLTPNDTSMEILNLVKSEFGNDPRVLDIAGSSCAFNQNWIWIGWDDPETEKKYSEVFLNTVDSKFCEILDLEFTAGRNFLPDNEMDWKESVIVNESFVEYMGWDDPIGQEIPGGFEPHHVIGVIRDFHFRSLQKEMRPLILLQNAEIIFSRGLSCSLPNWFTVQRALLKVQSEHYQDIIIELENFNIAHRPGKVFSFSFLDESIQKLYEEQQKWKKLVSLSSIFAIFIAALGLLGLSTLEVAQRTKEIGVRKVLGASTGTIIHLLSRQITLLVVAASTVALPASYLIMKKWLESFAYKITITPALLIVATLLALLVAWLTVGSLAFVAARRNPIHALRDE